MEGPQAASCEYFPSRYEGERRNHQPLARSTRRQTTAGLPPSTNLRPVGQRGHAIPPSHDVHSSARPCLQNCRENGDQLFNQTLDIPQPSARPVVGRRSQFFSRGYISLLVRGVLFRQANTIHNGLKTKCFGGGRSWKRSIVADEPLAHRRLGHDAAGCDHAFWEHERLNIAVTANFYQPAFIRH